MCEHARKLILWMDGELDATDALVVEKHLRECAECRECLTAYQQASAGFEAYCDAVVDVAEGASATEEARLAAFLHDDPNRIASILCDPNRITEAPRVEGASRQSFLSRLKPRPTKPSVERPGWPFGRNQEREAVVEENGGQPDISSGHGFSRAVNAVIPSGVSTPQGQRTIWSTIHKAVASVLRSQRFSPEFSREDVAETSPRSEGAVRRIFSARLKPCPDDAAPSIPGSSRLRGRSFSSNITDLVPSGALDPEENRPVRRQKDGGLKPAATKRERVVRLGVGAVAAAAAIAMVLMIPRHRVAQTASQIAASSTAAATASGAASGGPLHAVERPAQRPEIAWSAEGTSVHENTAETMTRGGPGSKDPAVATHGAEAQNAATRSETPPGANITKRMAPLAIATGVTHRHATGLPARPEDAAGTARTQTAQNGQMRSAGAARRRAAERPARVEEANGAAREEKNQVTDPVAKARQNAETAQTEEANAVAAETPIEIAVPTDGMFPPGAVPAGIGFTAVVTISADDFSQRSAMRPQGGLLPSSYQGLSPSPYQGLSPSPRVTGFSNGGGQP